VHNLVVDVIAGNNKQDSRQKDIIEDDSGSEEEPWNGRIHQPAERTATVNSRRKVQAYSVSEPRNTILQRSLPVQGGEPTLP
jgi:hypothetical protein